MRMSETSKIASAQAHQRVPPRRVRHRRVLQQSVAWSLLILKSPTPYALINTPTSACHYPCSDLKSRADRHSLKGPVASSTHADVPEISDESGFCYVDRSRPALSDVHLQ